MATPPSVRPSVRPRHRKLQLYRTRTIIPLHSSCMVCCHFCAGGEIEFPLGTWSIQKSRLLNGKCWASRDGNSINRPRPIGLAQQCNVGVWKLVLSIPCQTQPGLAKTRHSHHRLVPALYGWEVNKMVNDCDMLYDENTPLIVEWLQSMSCTALSASGFLPPSMLGLAVLP